MYAVVSPPSQSWRPSGARAARRQPRTSSQAKQHVPGDTFGGLSPERKAADALERLFTFIAARIVLSQLEGSGRGGLGAYNPQSWQDLSDHLHNGSLKDGDAWVAELCKRNEMLGLRVMEVRTAYAENDFEWLQVQRLAVKGVKESNLRLMRAQAESHFAKQVATEGQTEQGSN